jgi:hypothetical protein
MDEIQTEIQMTVEEAATDSSVGESAGQRRTNSQFAEHLKHIQAHRQDRLDDPDSLTVVLRDALADLMEIEASTADALRGAILICPMSAENIDDYAPMIDLILRLSKQISQTTQLQMRSSKTSR